MKLKNSPENLDNLLRKDIGQYHFDPKVLFISNRLLN